MTILEFAREMGVSATTVSRAISGRGRISSTTRQAILKSMKELGYIPNPHAQQLVTGRSQMIVLHHRDRDMLSDLFLVEMAHGIRNAMQARGYGLILDTGSSAREEDSLLHRWIVSRAIDGVIVKGLHPVREWVKQVAGSHIPFVVIGDPSVSDVPYVGSVLVDCEAAVREMAEMFVDLGHRRIGYIGNPMPDPALSVFRHHLEALGIDVEKDLLTRDGVTSDDGIRVIRELLSMPSPPTAVFARNDAIAVGALQAANAMRVRVPRDLSLVGYGDVPLAGIVDPQLTTVHVDFYELGNVATEMLFDLLDKPRPQPGVKHVQTRLMVRKSVSAVP